MSTKTIYKRIALVAVASLGFGVLTSVSPASAAQELPTAGAIVVASSTNIGAEATANTFVTRTSFSSLTLGGTLTQTTAASGFTAYLIDSADAIVTTTGITAGSGTSAAPATVTGTVAAGSGVAVIGDSAAGTTHATYSLTVGDLAAGTYRLVFDTNNAYVAGVTSLIVGTIRVVDAGAPKSVSLTTGSVTEVGAAADYASTFTVKDSTGATTVLVNNEKVEFDVTPVTGVSTTTVVMNTNQTTIDKADAISTTNVYTAGLNGDGGTNPASTGATIAGTEYTVSATLQDGSTALAAPVAFKYKRLSNTASLTGTLTFTSDSAGLKPITTLSTSSGVATANFYVRAKDANGGVINGATVAFTASTGAVTTAALNTTNGVTSNNTATPSAAGTQTITATIATGAATISATLAVTAAAGSALAASDNNWAVAKGNGTGVVVTSTAPATNAWDASFNVSSITATLSGLTPSSAVKLTVSGNAGTPTVNALTGTIYPIADATGKVTVTLAPSAVPTANQNIILDADSFVGGSYGGTDSTLTITYKAVAPKVTTAPLTASLNMATPSSTQTITATHTDQFGNAVTGGFMVLTNTVVPAAATAQTAVTVGTDATGKATLSAILGSALGTYTYTVQPKNSNGDNAGTASTISYAVTTTGIAGTLVLTDNDSPTSATVTTTDNKSTRQINVAPAQLQALGGGVTTDIVEITVATTTPAALGFTATATNGIRLFTTNPNNAVIGAGKSSVTGVAGTTSIFAVPTKVGAGTITVVSGGLTQVFTLTGALAVTADKANIITLTAATAAGQYIVKVTDIFGNGVVSDVAVSLSGPGAFSNGFKNLSVTTGADGTNTFNVVSDGSAATTITAVLPAANYNAITADQATASALTGGLGTGGATTDTATATLAGKGGDASATSIAALTTLINSLIAKINALNKLVIKIQKKVRA